MKKYRTLKEVIEAEQLHATFIEKLLPLQDFKIKNGGWAYIVFSKNNHRYMLTYENLKKLKGRDLNNYMHELNDNQIFMERIRGLYL